METIPFNIYYAEDNKMHTVEVRPCCNEDNVVDYAIWRDDKLAFTITKNKHSGIWVVALKNADDDIADELIQLIGAEIEKITGI